MLYAKIEMKLQLPIEFIKRKNWYAAISPVFDVASQGETQAKAKKNLIEALNVFLTTCVEHGTLDAVMKECGFKPFNARKVTRVHKSEYIKIPIHLLSSDRCQDRCHA